MAAAVRTIPMPDLQMVTPDNPAPKTRFVLNRRRGRDRNKEKRLPAHLDKKGIEFGQSSSTRSPRDEETRTRINPGRRNRRPRSASSNNDDQRTAIVKQTDGNKAPGHANDLLAGRRTPQTSKQAIKAAYETEATRNRKTRSHARLIENADAPRTMILENA